MLRIPARIHLLPAHRSLGEAAAHHLHRHHHHCCPQHRERVAKHYEGITFCETGVALLSSHPDLPVHGLVVSPCCRTLVFSHLTLVTNSLTVPSCSAGDALLFSPWLTSPIDWLVVINIFLSSHWLVVSPCCYAGHDLLPSCLTLSIDWLEVALPSSRLSLSIDRLLVRITIIFLVVTSVPLSPCLALPTDWLVVTPCDVGIIVALLFSSPLALSIGCLVSAPPSRLASPIDWLVIFRDVRYG